MFTSDLLGGMPLLIGSLHKPQCGFLLFHVLRKLFVLPCNLSKDRSTLITHCVIISLSIAYFLFSSKPNFISRIDFKRSIESGILMKCLNIIMMLLYFGLWQTLSPLDRILGISSDILGFSIDMVHKYFINFLIMSLFLVSVKTL